MDSGRSEQIWAVWISFRSPEYRTLKIIIYTDPDNKTLDSRVRRKISEFIQKFYTKGMQISSGVNCPFGRKLTQIPHSVALSGKVTQIPHSGQIEVPLQ